MKGVAREVFAFCLLFLIGCGDSVAHADLANAVTDGGRRTTSTPPNAQPVSWREHPATAQLGKSGARAICVTDSTIWVAEKEIGSVTGYKLSGARDTSLTLPAGLPWIDPVQLACGSNTVAVIDQGRKDISIFSASRTLLARVPAYLAPQGLPVAGAIEFLDDTTIIESWLGTDNQLGPFLSETEWRDESLAILHGARRDSLRLIGQPRAYVNTVARRGLNRTFLRMRKDTLWILTQGDARLLGFPAANGRTPSAVIPLDVYHIGRSPLIDVGKPFSGDTGLRFNQIRFDANVGPFAFLGDSSVAVVTYGAWKWTIVSGSIERTASSYVDIIRRDRRPTVRYAVSGFAYDLEVRQKRLFTLVRDQQGKRHLLFADLPG